MLCIANMLALVLFSGQIRSLLQGNGTPLQYSCLENPMDGGAWKATCSPWGRWGSDTTERLHFHFSLSCIGEGNGNPLQCSCPENPRDGGAWWAAVYGVAESDTTEGMQQQQPPCIQTMNSFIKVLQLPGIRDKTIPFIICTKKCSFRITYIFWFSFKWLHG